MSKEVPQEIQDMFDSYPDEEELKDFDSFLIGDGSASMMSKLGQPRRERNFQLTGINSIDDLGKKHEDTCDHELIDDLDEYSIELDIDTDIKDYYFKVKKDVFNVYDFIKIRSKKMAGRPRKEIDLVISNNEHYLLKYLGGRGDLDYGIIDSLAQVKALLDMGFLEAKFNQVDCCPICEAYDGNVYNLTQLAELFGSGKFLTHSGCLGKFIPVIRDREKVLNDLIIDLESVFVDKVKVNNLPIEYRDELYSIIPFTGVSVIHFMDIVNHFDDYENEFVRLVDDELYIHNGYYGSFSPADFLVGWVECNDIEVGVDSQIDACVKAGDIYYLDGRQVVEIEGIHFDVETKGQVK